MANHAKIISSPVGRIYLSSNDEGLTSIRPAADGDKELDSSAYIASAEKWLEAYFSGVKKLPSLPIFHFEGTEFQKAVWKMLLEIPYGQTVTYGSLAKKINGNSMLSRAIGQAVGKNKFMILIPCHRVIGSKGNLTGYAYGLEMKKWLLDFEKK